jgi:TolB protein
MWLLFTPNRLRLFLAINLAILVVLIWPLLRSDTKSPAAFSAPVTSAVRITASTASLTPNTDTTPTASPRTSTPLPETTPGPSETAHQSDDLIVLSIAEGGYNRLFAYQPDGLHLTRLTNGLWDDITPAISPNQNQVAFSSNRHGHWNLYLLDLDSGEITQLTDWPGYKAAPSWSPDGNFLVYEAYLEDKLSLVILDMSGTQSPIILRNQSEADFSPAWSPLGRQIAFTSIVAGKREIWIADLDKSSQERFTKLSEHPSAVCDHPTWSPDGSQLAYSMFEKGLHHIYIWEQKGGIRYLGSGDQLIWSSDGSTLLTTLSTPAQTMMTAYSIGDFTLAIPPVLLPGPVSGLTWSNASLPSPLPAPLTQAAKLTSTPLWNPTLTIDDDSHLVSLENVNAPNPCLHDMVDESFDALRQRVALAAGWDLLADLENAYVPITAPLPPGLGNDWLYTGRAFAISPLPINAGWMVVMREEYGTDIYWRIYLRARDQDGSQGVPLKQHPWDFSRRHQGDMGYYEQGGGYFETIPDGYWVDFTSLATAYGWERLPALPTWRASFPAARFNQFVLSDNQEWRAAMLELYPPEALITPTLFVPPTLTPTATPRWYRTPTPGVSP